jgi:pilus assembly protein Flp/PilA
LTVPLRSDAGDPPVKPKRRRRDPDDATSFCEVLEIQAMSVIYKFLGDEDGPTAVEYAVLLALILASIIAAIVAFGQGAGGMWSNNGTAIGSALGGS